MPMSFGPILPLDYDLSHFLTPGQAQIFLKIAKSIHGLCRRYNARIWIKNLMWMRLKDAEFYAELEGNYDFLCQKS